MGRRSIENAPIDAVTAAAMVGVCRNTFVSWLSAGHVSGAYRTHGNRGHWRLVKTEFMGWLARYQDGSVVIPRKKRKPAAKPVKGGLRSKLMEVRI